METKTIKVIMSQDRVFLPGQIVRHFKGGLYRIIGPATHTETEEPMMVYQALYGNGDIFVRPYKMFCEEVDHEKYPDATQKYRVEIVYMME